MVSLYRNLLPATVGFDRLISTIEQLDKAFAEDKPEKYPPYNIFTVDKTNEYYIEMAVAGFDEDEIEVTLENNVLWVEGSHKTSTTVNFIHHGLAERDFKHRFVLSDTAGVDSITLKNGILSIKLVDLTPEEKKPIKLAINKLPEKVVNN